MLGEAPASAARVARLLGRTRQGVQRVIDLLASEALIAARDNPDNVRSPLFEPTEAGRAVLVKLNGAAVRWHRQVLEELNEDELADLTAALKRLAALAREHPPRTPRSRQTAE